VERTEAAGETAVVTKAAVICDSRDGWLRFSQQPIGFFHLAFDDGGPRCAIRPATSLGNNWVDVPNSTGVNSVTITINPAHGAQFYRLVYY
jgi:hypothetical protein